ncbi:MAG TPA: hypothetical protein VHG30_14600 [Microvirga sp.]|jgi:antitoxin MazE|nr:hypothetical protein [Microvirga sp.]
MVIQFARWGNSIALRVPHTLVREIGAAEGMAADIVVRDGKLVVTPLDPTPRYELSELLAGITEENRHGEIATGAAVGNEFEG